MAEDQIDRRRDYLKELLPWTKLFSAFKIALDPKKLLLAAGGIVVMSLGWYVLSVIVFSISPNRPKWNVVSYPEAASSDVAVRQAGFQKFKLDRHQWYLLYEMAGTPPLSADTKNPELDYVKDDAADLVDDPEKLAKAPPNGPLKYRPYGRFRMLPWFEDRGPNPYLLVTGNVSEAQADRGIVNWFISDQLPVLLEPLVKFFQPIVYLFDPAAGFMNRIYLVLIILWSLATWAFFGGAITRIAAVQVARTNERVGLKEAVKFVWARYKAYLAAPVFALLFLAGLTVLLFIFGLLEGWTYAFGDIVFPLLWPVVLLIGLIMAVVLVGLVGWPLMYTTISSEGSDSFDAISRSYSYVYQAPWHYIWYSLVALVYGAVLVFFVVFMGSLTVYLGKWAVGLAPTTSSREPSYLFRWAPTSFGWRELLLHQSPHKQEVNEVSPRGGTTLQKQTEIKSDDDYKINEHNNFGAFVVSVWLYLFFLLIVGFGYSYFWTATTIIYLLMRLKVDDTEADEIHLEEEPEPSFPPPAGSTFTPPGAEPPKTMQPPPQMVEAPQLRTPTPVAVVTPGAPPGAEAPKPASQPDGAPPPGGAH